MSDTWICYTMLYIYILFISISYVHPSPNQIFVAAGFHAWFKRPRRDVTLKSNRHLVPGGGLFAMGNWLPKLVYYIYIFFKYIYIHM